MPCVCQAKTFDPKRNRVVNAHSSSPRQDIKPETQAPAVSGEINFSVVSGPKYTTPGAKHPERRAFSAPRSRRWTDYSLADIDCAWLTSRCTPGPIVVVMVMLLMYEPLAAAGRAFLIASMNAAKFSTSLVNSKDALPMGT